MLLCVGFGYGYASYGLVACGLLFSICYLAVICLCLPGLLAFCVCWVGWYRLLRLFGFTLITGFVLIDSCMLDVDCRFSLLVGYYCWLF